MELTQIPASCAWQRDAQFRHASRAAAAGKFGKAQIVRPDAVSKKRSNPWAQKIDHRFSTPARRATTARKSLFEISQLHFTKPCGVGPKNEQFG